MKRVKTIGGEIILVPTQTGEYGVAKVIYASRVFRNLILVGIYRIAMVKAQAPDSLPGRFAVPCIYTGSQRIKTGEWSVVAHTSVSTEEVGLSRRIVGGHVWLADEYLRDATPEDKASLPVMDAWHCSVIVDQVEAVIATITSDSCP